MKHQDSGNEIAHFPDEVIVRLEDNWWGPSRYPPRSLWDLGFGDLLRSCGVECWLWPRPIAGLAANVSVFFRDLEPGFMQYYQGCGGVTWTPLATAQEYRYRPGPERLTMVLQGKESVFDTDMFRASSTILQRLPPLHMRGDAKTDTSSPVDTDRACIGFPGC